MLKDNDKHPRNNNHWLFRSYNTDFWFMEEGKDDEIQIGFPTDVKHVAHIGWDGPAVHESPSWMKEFNSPSALKSAPLGPPPGDPIQKPEVQWVSEDSKRGQRAIESQGGDPSHVPRSSRRHNSTDSNSNDSPRKKDPSSKSSRQSRRHKDSSEGSVKSTRKTQDSGPSSGLPDIPKKSRRKKSKDFINGDGSSRGKSTKGDNDPNGENGGGSSRGKSKWASKHSDPEIANDSIEQIVGPQSGPLPDILDREEK